MTWSIFGRAPAPCSGTAPRCQPQLENLDDRIVPSTVALQATLNRTVTLVGHVGSIEALTLPLQNLDASALITALETKNSPLATSIQAATAGLTAVQADLQALNNDLSAVKTEIETSATNFINWFNSQPADYQQVVRPFVTKIITNLIADEFQIQSSLTFISSLTNSLARDVQGLMSGNLANQALAGFAIGGDLKDAGKIPDQFFNYLFATIDATNTVQLLDQVASASPATSQTTDQVAQTAADCCNGTISGH